MLKNPELGYTPNNLRALRATYGLTQADVAEIVGVKPRIIRRWEADLSNESAHSDMSLAKWCALVNFCASKQKK